MEPHWELEFELFGEFQGGKGEVRHFRCFNQLEDTGWKRLGPVASGGGGPGC